MTNRVFPWFHTIISSLEKKAYSHAYILSGNEGLGKRDFSYIFSQILLCSKSELFLACNECKSCHLFLSKTHPDFYEIDKEKGKKNISINQIKEIKNNIHETSFLNGSKDERVERKELFKNTYSDYIVKNQEKSNNIYALAISLKNLEEFDLSRMAYQSLFINHKDDLSGDIFAEYTQVLYFSEGRRFTEQTKELLDLTLLKAPDNPVALTLKGLQYLGEKNLDQTIIQWSKAASFITNEREKEELKIAIKALNNRKNQ